MSRLPTTSVPCSPKVTRSSSDQNYHLPVTPQRVTRVHKQLRSASSPLTPGGSSVTSSPFTPLTNICSPLSLATPSSSASSGTKVDLSPEIIVTKNATSLADTASNWRTRAKENGIKVSVQNIGAEGTNNDLKASKDILPASFLSTHRRPRQAQFQAKSSDITALTSPIAARIAATHTDKIGTPSPRRPLSTLNTPSPRTSLAIIERLRVRGSVTDPARTRRRPAFGAPSGESLFDIDENSTESGRYPHLDSPLPVSRASRIRSASEPSHLSGSGTAVKTFITNRPNTLCDPFPKIQSTHSTVSSLNNGSTSTSEATAFSNACSVCSSTSSLLSCLIPCEHLICSSCLTGALNIVGEKDMQCAACESIVKDFKLLTPLGLAGKAAGEDSDDITSPTISLLPSMFDEFKISGQSRNKHEDLASPPLPSLPLAGNMNETITIDGELAVLRIDNVPWDLTPPALCLFFEPYTTARAHVLLDPKGKTLSHAYVEISPQLAKQALRGVQNKTMGNGRRMRGVTVTMSSQAELMRALFPNWRGIFDGSKPSLNGLDNDRIIRTLEQGLISLNELDSLITLMRHPDSHFLKVPSLPFYSLISILYKFPADIDSRVFWSSTLRDLLYDMTFAATQMVISRIGQAQHNEHLLEQMVQAGMACKAFTEQQHLRLIEVVDPTMATHAEEFSSPSSKYESGTASSRSEFDEAGTPEDATSSESESAHPFAFGCDSRTQAVVLHTPTPANYACGANPCTPYDKLAREFGVEPDLVHALAQRLAISAPAATYYGC